MRIAVIGSNERIVTRSQKIFAFSIGKNLVDEDYIIVNGGMGGIMAEVARGARESSKFTDSSVLAILPVIDEKKGNPYSGIIIKTDMGSARNRLIIINCDTVLAIGGGAGTLNEITLAWELKKPIAVYTIGGGWAGELAGRRIDNRRSDEIVGIKTVDELLNWLLLIKKKD